MFHELYTVQNVPLKLWGWAEMEIPGADSKDTHFPFGEWIGCGRFRRETGGGWGLPATPGGSARRSIREDVKSSNSVQAESA